MFKSFGEIISDFGSTLFAGVLILAWLLMMGIMVGSFLNSMDTGVVEQIVEIENQHYMETGEFLPSDEFNENGYIGGANTTTYHVITNEARTCWVAAIPSVKEAETNYWITHNRLASQRTEGYATHINDVVPENYNWCVPSIDELVESISETQQ